MASLKDVCAEVANVVGVPASTTYAHGRELVRSGILEPRGGVGPGSGVLATPKTVATLIVAELIGACEGWVRIGDKMHAASKLKDADGVSLVDALAEVLAMDPLPKEIWLQVAPTRAEARLTYSDAEVRHFIGKGKTPSGIVLDASIYRGIHQIAAAMKRGKQ